MKIKGWDKLSYKNVFLCGAGLTISSAYKFKEDMYTMEFDDADNVGNTLLKVHLEAKESEFFMTAFIVPTQIYPNIRRVFRRKDMLDMNEFLVDVLEELTKNTMVNSYLNLIAQIQNEKAKAIFNSSSINLPF